VTLRHVGSVEVPAGVQSCDTKLLRALETGETEDDTQCAASLFADVGAS
jgi:hypothetical protein